MNMTPLSGSNKIVVVGGGAAGMMAAGMAAQAGDARCFHGGLGADGPRTLYTAVLTAATPETAKQGVVVAMDL